MMILSIFHYHPSDANSDAIAQYGLHESDVHDVFNLFMCSGIDSKTHEYLIKGTPARRGDFLTIQAEIDLLASCCASGSSPRDAPPGRAKEYSANGSQWASGPQNADAPNTEATVDNEWRLERPWAEQQRHQQPGRNHAAPQSQMTRDDTSFNLQHISDREFVDISLDPSTHPTAKPTFMERSQSDMRMSTVCASQRGRGGSVGPATDPDHRTIYRFVRTLFHAAQLTAECAIITLVYIERLLNYAEMDLYGSNWRRVVLGAIMMASKVWDDQAVWNVDYCQILPDASVEDMNELERQFLELLEFNINVPSSVYAKYYFDLRTLALANDLQLPLQPLYKERAQRLEALSRDREYRLLDDARRSADRKWSSAERLAAPARAPVVIS